MGFDHGTAEGVPACGGAGLVFVGFAIRFLLPFALECGAYLPDSTVGGVLKVTVKASGDGDEGPGGSRW